MASTTIVELVVRPTVVEPERTAWVVTRPNIALGPPGRRGPAGVAAAVAPVNYDPAGGVISLDIASPAFHHAASHGDAGADRITIDAGQITTGIFADALIPDTITRDAELDQRITDTVTALEGGAPDLLNTFREIADALNDDANFAATINAAIAANTAAIGAEAGRAGGVEAGLQAAVNANTAAIAGNTAALGTFVTIGTPQTITSPKTFQAASATSNPLIVQGAAAQSANLTSWLDSAGNTVTKIGSNGFVDIFRPGTLIRGYLASGDAQAAMTITTTSLSFGVGGTTAPDVTLSRQGTGLMGVTGAFRILNATASAVPFNVRGAASQTANLQEWQDSTAAVLVKVTASGQVNVVNDGNPSAFLSVISPSSRPLVVRGVASQAANLTEWQATGGTIVAAVDATGRGSFGTSAGVLGGAALTAGVTGTANIGIVVRGLAGQTANLQQWQDSTGVVLASIASDGGMNTKFWYAPSGSATTIYTRENQANGLVVSPNNATTTTARNTLLVNDTFTQAAGANAYNGIVIQSVVNQTGGATGAVAGLVISPTLTAVTTWRGIFIANQGGVGNSILSQGGTAQFETGAAATRGVVVKGAASQTADLQQWQDSTAAMLAKVTALGSLYVPRLLIPSAGADTNGYAIIYGQATAPMAVLPNGTLAQPASVGGVGLIVKALASQTGDLQQWQSSAGASVASVAPNGQVTSSVGYVGPFVVDVASTGAFVAMNPATGQNGAVQISTRAAANKGLLVKGSASQTGNLIEAQDSVGTTLARLTSGGTLVVSAIYQSSRNGAILQGTNAGAFQITVGAAGPAAALPATPTKYMKVRDDIGTDYVVPMYAAA